MNRYVVKQEPIPGRWMIVDTVEQRHVRLGFGTLGAAEEVARMMNATDEMKSHNKEEKDDALLSRPVHQRSDPKGGRG